MAQPVIQTAFHAGEFSPNLYARVDLQKYHSGVALAENWYVDYRGGMSTRMGTKYILRGLRDTTQIRLIPFQASTDVGYVLEFGDLYIRFINNGSYVLEDAIVLTAASNANPAVFTKNTHGLQNGDWVFASDFAGGTWPTLMNDKYFIVAGVTTNTFTLTDLWGTAISGVGQGTWSAGDVQRVYTLASPYSSDQLSLIKFASNVSSMTICHPEVQTQILSLITATNWTITPKTYGATVTAPTNIAVATTLAAGNVNYSYTVTAVDANGQEGAAGTAGVLASKTDLRTVAGTNRITWTAVAGATRYNVYKAELSYTNAVATGAAHGYIGFAAGTTFDDSNIAPDFSECPPVIKSPFSGAGVESVTITAPGTGYTSVPTVTFSDAPSGGATAQGVASAQIASATLADAGIGYSVGDLILHNGATGQPDLGVVLVVATVNGIGGVTAIQPLTYPGTNKGSVTSGPLAVNNEEFDAISGGGHGAEFDLVWEIGAVVITNEGAGYLSAPTVSFAGGAGSGTTATANLFSVESTNPTVPQFAFQRLWLMGPTNSPQRFDASKPGFFGNFNVSDPAQPDDAISGILVSGILNEIKSAIPMPSGLIILASGAAWQIYGNSPGQAPNAVDATAQSQAYNGASDVPPIVANFDILYVQAKGSSVRNLSYNFYTNIYTGTDISVLSSHLFYNKSITEWCWAEEPFKVVWAIRDDGVCLSLTFLKEQELIGWTHSITDGLFKSCAVIQEDVDGVKVDAVYFVIERTINGETVQYIERMADRDFTDYIGPWCVDAGLRYDGSPATTFSGVEHLIGEDIVGLADGIPFTATVSASGTFTLANAASFVTAGLQFTPKFQTLRIDTGNPTIQGKMKLINQFTARVTQTLGLRCGKTEATAVVWKDLRLGNVSTMQNATITDLVTGDAKQAIDPQWDTAGQVYIDQPLPYPATILGVIPELSIGDTPK